MFIYNALCEFAIEGKTKFLTCSTPGWIANDVFVQDIRKWRDLQALSKSKIHIS